LYGDRIIEKTGINRDKPGEPGEVLENPRFSMGTDIFQAGKARSFSNSMSERASTAVDVFFYAQGPQEGARRRRRDGHRHPAEQENPRKTAKKRHSGGFS